GQNQSTVGIRGRRRQDRGGRYRCRACRFEEPVPIVYKKEACVQCDATVRYLPRRQVPFELRTVDDLDPELRKRHLRAPVVVAPDGREWSGFNPDYLKTLVQN